MTDPTPTLFVKTVHQVWTHHPVLGDLPAGPRYQVPGIPLPIDQFSFEDILDAHDACILLEDYLRRHHRTPTRKGR